MRSSVNLVEQTSSCDSDVSSSFRDTTVVLVHVLLGQWAVACEEQVDLLERLACDFGVEEVDDWRGDDVHAGEEDEGAPAETGEHDRDHEGVHAAADGPAENGKRVHLCADLLGLAFTAVEPAGNDVEDGEDDLLEISLMLSRGKIG